MIFQTNDRKLFVGPFSWPNLLSCLPTVRRLQGNKPIKQGKIIKYVLRIYIFYKPGMIFITLILIIYLNVIFPECSRHFTVQ